MTSITTLRHRLGALGVLATLIGAAAPAHAAAEPDLTTASVGVDPGAVAEGDDVTVVHALRTTSAVRSPASVTRFYLSPDPVVSQAERAASRTVPRSSWSDVRLVGQQALPALAGSSTSAVRSTLVTVPVGTAPGTYAVLACADDLGTVTEVHEEDNCTVASSPLQVSAATGSLDLEAFSQTYPWPEREDLSVLMLQTTCRIVKPPRTLTLAQSLAGLRSHLNRTAGADAMAMVATSPLAATAPAAQGLAAEGVLQGSPGLAAAALLRAHALEPANGGHLVNLAGLAVSMGLPNEALGLLDGAATRTLRTPAVGVPQRAIALAVRGQALVLTGRLGAARTAFTAASAAAPLLSEADTGLATVAACTGDTDGAVRGLRDGRQREQDDVPGRPDPGLDLTLGKVSPLRVLPVAETPAAGVRMKGLYDSIAAGFLGETETRSAEAEALAAHMGAGDQERSRAEVRRRSSIVALASAAHDDPDIVARDAVFETALQRLVVTRERFFGGSPDGSQSTYEKVYDAARATCSSSTQPGCFDRELLARCRPALNKAHAAWRTQLSLAQKAGNAYYGTLSRRMTAYVANLADPDARGIVLLDVAGREMGTYERLTAEAQLWTMWEELRAEDCITPAAVEVPTAPDAEDVEAEDGCPDRLKGIDFVFELGPSTLKANCEKVEQEFVLEIAPFVEAFVETTYDSRAGSVTVFAGGKLGSKIGGVVDAGFKSGIYVSVDTKTGEFTDIGWRVGPKATAGSSHVEITLANQEMDFSFVAGLQGIVGE